MGCIVKGALCSMHCEVCIVQCALCIVQCASCSKQGEWCGVQYAMYSMACRKGCVYHKLDSLCTVQLTLCNVLAMAKIRRIGHDHQAPFWHLLVVLVVGISSGDTRQKHATTYTIYFGPPIFLQILNFLLVTNRGAN